jgi:hypothetical protein
MIFEKRFIKIEDNITIGINNGYMYQLLARSSGLYSVNEVVKAIIKITVPQNQKIRRGCSFFLKLKNV